MAVRRRRPKRTIFHSDQRSQCGSDDWRRFCRNSHLEPSMSRGGNCRDDAVAGSFFSRLKKERIKKKIHGNRDPAQADISAYIESFYNRTRRSGYDDSKLGLRVAGCMTTTSYQSRLRARSGNPASLSQCHSLSGDSRFRIRRESVFRHIQFVMLIRLTRNPHLEFQAEERSIKRIDSHVGAARFILTIQP
jgi:hypothetical protein